MNRSLRSRLGVALVLLSACVQPWKMSWSQSQAATIRSVDFKNFSYPWIHPSGWPDHLQWMSLRLQQNIRLVNGKWDGRDESDKVADSPFSGLTLEGVQYARLTSNHGEDAIVVLRYDTGGTQYHYWVYIYGDSGGTPKLLGFFRAGDRAAHGLYQSMEWAGLRGHRETYPGARGFDIATACFSLRSPN